jgi:long-chain acyl-CoA synthetase
VSALVARFARLCETQPTRKLIHLPADTRSVEARTIWDQHLVYADAFRSFGLKPGHLVLLAVGNRAPVVPLLLAARACGMAAAAVDAGTTGAELTGLVQQFGAAAVVGAIGELPSLGIPAALPDRLALVSPQGTPPSSYPDIALLKITSGSTGRPKASMSTDTQLVADSEQILQGMAIGPDDTQIAVIPLSHAYGTSVILVPLLLQGTPMVLRESFVPQQLPADALEHGARVFAGVPYMFEYFLSHPPAEGWPVTLQTLISAGARLPGETVRAFAAAFGVKIHTFYGASESGGISYDASDAIDEGETVGTPLPGVTVSLRPDEEAAEGGPRVHVRSAGVACGYAGESSDAFCEGGFLTGDYGRLDEQGRLRLTGRASTFINVAGRKVQPAEVEDVLRQMPGVRDVRVLGAPDPQRGEQVVACLAVDPADAASVTALAVRRFCSSRLAAFKIPRTVICVDRIPLTARGKTDRRALEALVRGRNAGITEQLC